MSLTALGEAMGMTRNMIAGRVHRMRHHKGIKIVMNGPTKPTKEEPKRKSRAVKPKTPPQPKPVVEIKKPPEKAAIVPSNVYSNDHRWDAYFSMSPAQCRWLEGDHTPYAPCNKTRREDSSWCKEHHARVYTFTARYRG